MLLVNLLEELTELWVNLVFSMYNQIVSWGLYFCFAQVYPILSSELSEMFI